MNNKQFKDSRFLANINSSLTFFSASPKSSLSKIYCKIYMADISAKMD